MSNELKTKSAALTALAVMAAGTLLASCGANNTPAAGNNTDLQSNSSQSPDSSHKSGGGGATNELSFPDAQSDTGKYANGIYHVEGTYGIESKNTLTASVTVLGGKVTAVDVKTKSDGDISQKYSNAFMKQIKGEVVGKELKGLKLDVVAGASWTTEAFNQALTNVRGDASNTSMAAK